MLRCHLKMWAAIGAAVILGLVLCCPLALANETQSEIPDDPLLQIPSSAVGDMGFFLKFSQRYYQAVETSLHEKSYFAFRYYLISHFESFDKRQFISENPTQANDIAQRALRNVIRQTLNDIELFEILSDYVQTLTSFKLVIGANGTRLHEPSLADLGLQNSALETDPNHKMILSAGLTSEEDLRLGLMLSMTYHGIMSKLRYYPTSQRNEIVCTAETHLTSSTKIALSYHSSQDGSAVLTALSFQF